MNFPQYLKNVWRPPPSTAYGPLIRLLSYWSMMSCALPIVFSGKGTEVVLLKGPRQLGLLAASVLTMALNCAVFMLHFCKAWLRKGPLSSSNPVWKELMMGYFFAVLVIIFGCQIVSLWRKTECKFLVKTAFEMETFCREVWGASNYTIKYLVWFCELVKMTYFSVTIAVSGLAVVRPCTPPSLGSILLEDCQAGWERPGGISFTQKILLGLFEGYTWYLMTVFCVFFHGGVLIYPSEMMRLWVILVERQAEKSPQKMKAYRVAQVVQNVINSFWRKPLMSLLLLSIMTAEIMSMYILSTSFNQLTLPIRVFFLVVWVDFFFDIHVLIKCLSLSHLCSELFVKNMKGRTRSAWGKRFIRSCSSLRISLGGGNFFDGVTSLVIWQFCVDRVINLLLV